MPQDARVTSAIAHWGPRFVANGVSLTDFEEVTASLSSWEGWCGAWSGRAAQHEELGREALEPFLGQDAALLAGGHTHLQWTRRIEDALYVNPGSVGISYDRHADPPVMRALAEWALVTVTDGTVAVEFRQVPYAIEGVQAAAKRSGRPYADEWAAQWSASSRP